MAAVIDIGAPASNTGRHAPWVRSAHWVLAASVLLLAFSGFEILMVHPRLYWGKAGNDLTPALVELPVSRNYRHGGWGPPVVLIPGEHPIVSRGRTYDIFNQNGWGRSLHFLSAWFLLATSTGYFAVALASGHLRRNLLPRLRELTPGSLWQDVQAHLRRPRVATHAGPPYNLLQRLSYAFVLFLLLPLMVLTGLTMSPGVTAALPGLLDVFGGSQSARTLHFAGFALLIVFVGVHIAMVIVTGFVRQVRAMTIGG